MQSTEVERVISYYDNTTDIIVGEYPIDVDIDQLKSIFKVKKNDPLMYEGYLVTPKKARLLSEKGVCCEYDFKKYSYFVECYQKNT